MWRTNQWMQCEVVWSYFKNERKKCSFYVSLFAAFVLSVIAIIRTDFSLEKIDSPFVQENLPISNIAHASLFQPYTYLGKGRQSFVFESADGKTVLKFFNRKYFDVPWYGYFSSRERYKRERRKSFYSQSYILAEKYLSKESGILYLHLGPTVDLPTVKLIDRAKRVFLVDLNTIPFVLQKKAEPFYSAIVRAQKEQGDEKLKQILVDFLEMISRRISFHLADAEHDVEHNIGFLDGKPLYIDPGRLLLADFSHMERLHHEWWSATHALRKWLSIQFPWLVSFFDSQILELENSKHFTENVSQQTSATHTTTLFELR